MALVLIPQSMAYAQLAGLPSYYGLYAAFLPPIIAALFGSSRQLATGPVAIVSLMTATALEPLATAGGESFIAYAILLALLVGVFQLALGLLRLGLIVNFLSHPVVNGFTSAAALIIASSQLSKLFGVTVDQAEHHYETIWRVLQETFICTHWPTLALAVLAFLIMIALRRTAPRLPNVLIAVLVTTAISWAMGFENQTRVSVDQIESGEIRNVILQFDADIASMESTSAQRVALLAERDSLARLEDPDEYELLDIDQKVAYLNADMALLKDQTHNHRLWLRRLQLTGVESATGQTHYYLKEDLPAETQVDGPSWHIKVSSRSLDTLSLALSSGGAVVGTIPEGLPRFSPARFDLSTALSLLPMAIIISLLGFMEAISIAKAMAARTGQKLDANQELVGQGLSNIVGSFFQSYAVSGSFSRSAVNIQAGAVTGLSNVVSSAVVVVVLLFLTPLLYHLPQAVLAAIIMMAVAGLLNVKSFVHAWRAHWYDGVIGIVTFVCTLVFAPHLHWGILIGVILSLLLYLIRNMKPAMAMLSLHVDNTYRNRELFDLEQCPYFAVIRYAGSVIFSNVDYLENQVLGCVRSLPKLRHILIVGNGINEIDASGVDALSLLIDRLRGQGIEFSLSGCNDDVLDLLTRTGLAAKIGENNFYRNISRAIDGIWEKAHINVESHNCPLRVRRFRGLAVSSDVKKGIAEDSNSEQHAKTQTKKEGGSED